MTSILDNFTDVLVDPDEISGSQPTLNSQPLSLSSVEDFEHPNPPNVIKKTTEPNITWQSASHSNTRPAKGTGQYGKFRSVDEIDEKYRNVFSYPFFNLVQSRVIDAALYSDKSMVVCAPTGSGKTVVFEMAIVRLLMELEDRNENNDFKIIYMAPVKSLCTERLTEWHSKFTKLGLLCIEVTGDTDVDFSQLKPYRIIITTPEKWDMLTRRWRDHRQLVEVIKLFLIDEVHILNDDTRGPVLEAVVSRMKTIETSVQYTHRIEQLQQHYQGATVTSNISPSIRFVAISATVSNPEDVATWLGTTDKPAVYYKFGDECRPVKLKRVVEGYPCAEGTSIFKFDLVLNYKLWPIIQKYHNGKPTLIFCNTRKSVAMTAETLSREITISFNDEQKARLTALASTIKNKKLQTLVVSGVGCHHAGLLYEERMNIEQAFRNRDLPILITTTTLAMGVNLPAHLVIIKNTQQYVNGAYQEYSITTVLQMVGRAGRPQFDTEATAVIMTRMADKQRYQALVGGCEPLQSYLHKRLPENLNSEAALGTVSDVAQCVQWLRSTFLCVRAAKDPKRYLGLPQTAPHYQISKKIEELCVKAMNGLASSCLITMDEACCIESTEAGRLMSIFYLDLETMKHIMKIDGSESLERLLWIVCESHELSDMHLRIDERRCLNALNRNNAASTIRFPMKGKITTRQMKLNCVIQAILGCLPIPDPSLNQEAMKVMRIADRVCKCLVAYVTRPALISQQPKYYSAVLNAIILAKCIAANLWENSVFVSKQLKGIGPTFSTLLATAGKVNFMLLEESHPRDLERIMNKGPPAGNILRKQVSLFPKYQLTMTPIDEKVVSIQLALLNHHNLSENMEHLTAGTGHKSYVVIGDSENILLQLTSFRDIDLIGVYDGSITYQVTRKHGFEHKIYAHCISSNFAGIDAQCEYVFKDIEPQLHAPQADSNDDLVRKPVKKQTIITDTFRERKRKSTENDITQSKEKKKRESEFFEKFKNLKESFGKTSKVLKNDLNKSAVMSEKILHEFKYSENPDISSAFDIADVTIAQNSVINDQIDNTILKELNDNNEFTNDDFMDDIKINDILNEIECEISKESSKAAIQDNSTLITKYSHLTHSTATPRPENIKSFSSQNSYPKIEKYKAINNNRKRLNKSVPQTTNFNFIDLLEKNEESDRAEETTVQEKNSFSDAIRSHIEKYLQKAKTTVKPPNTIIDLMKNEPVRNIEIEPLVIVHDSNITDKDVGKKLDNTGLKSKNWIKSAVIQEAVNVTAKQVSILQDELKNIDLTSDEFIKTSRQSTEKIDEENDLPVVNLLGINEKNDDTENVENTEINIIPEYHNAEGNINFYKNNTISENSNPMSALIKSLRVNTQELSKTTDLQKQHSVSELVAYDCPVQSNKTVIDRHSTDEANPHPIPKEKEKQQTVEIEPLRSDVPNKINNEPRELVVNNHLTPISTDIHNDCQHQIRDDSKLTIALASVSNVQESNEKPELRVMKVWKNYIKELPSLKLNNKEVPEYATHDSENKITFNKQNDVKGNLEFDVLNAGLDLHEKQKLAETALSKIKGFIPSFKNITTNLGQNDITSQIALQTPTPLQRQSLLKIDLWKNNNHEENNEITTFGLVNCDFDDQSISNQQNYSNKPFAMSNIVSRTDYRMLKHVSRVPELQENPEQSITEQKNNIVTIGNHPASTPLEMQRTTSFTSELYKNHKPNEIESLIMEEIKAINTTSAFKNDSSYIHTSTQNKYSFSTNKTDVTTQKTADHIVRVIKNLKIDLDITEIISKDNKSDKNCTGVEEHVDINQEDSSVAFKRPKLAITQGIEQRSSNADNRLNSKKLRDYSCDTLKKSDVLIEVKTPPESKIQLNNHTKLMTERDGHSEIDKTNEKELNTFKEVKIEDSTEKTKPNNVLSILQKYSNIMRNKPRNADLNLVPTKANEKALSTTKNDKPKRPFKISEIHRLNPIPIPDLLLDEPKPVNVTECFNLLEPKNKQAKLEQNKQLNICDLTISVPKEHDKEQEFSKDRYEVVENITEKLEDIPCYDPLSYEDLQVKIISNIDQTMFNPKALLQCLSNDEPEDIVPPPPEFCDYALDTNRDESFSTDCYEPIGCEEEIMDISHESKHSRSVSQDNEHVELTPSKEIETWNLSKDEGSCKMYASPALSPYTFTIIRKNKETSEQSSTLPRNKLNQFKFNHKNKYKL